MVQAQRLVTLLTIAVLPRPATKRAAALAFINCLSNVCQIYMPYLYPGTLKASIISSYIKLANLCWG